LASARVQHLAQRAELVRPRVADRLRQQVADAERREPEVDVRRAELGALGGDDQVAREHGEAGDAHRVAVHGGDHGLVHRDDAVDDAAELHPHELMELRGRKVAGAHHAQVPAGRERLARPGEDHDADVQILRGLAQRAAELARHPRAVGVEGLGLPLGPALRYVEYSR
jgi:hypothetical protein